MELPKELTIVTPLSKKLALLMFILMPVIGFFFGMQYQEKIDLQTHQQEKLLKPTPTQTPTPQQIDMTNWKTYTNENFGYSIQYPSDYEPYGQSSKPFDLSIIPAKDARIVTFAVARNGAIDLRNTSELDQVLITIIVSDINELKRTREEQEIIEKDLIEHDQFYAFKHNDININGSTGDVKSTFYKGEFLSKEISIDLKLHSYFLHYNDSLKAKYPSKYPSLNETVLSTFKFTDQADGKNIKNMCEGEKGTWLNDYKECMGLDEKTCTSLGGNFNGCASACRHNPKAEMCIQMCVEVCEF